MPPLEWLIGRLARSRARIRHEGIHNKSSVIASRSDRKAQDERIERAVCAIEGAGHQSGTGVLVGPDVVMTNHHVVRELFSNAAFAGRCVCRFDYHDNWPTGSYRVGLAPDWHLLSSPAPESGPLGRDRQAGDQLDYALIRLAHPVGSFDESHQPAAPGHAVRGWVTIPTSPTEPGDDLVVRAFHHPARDPANPQAGLRPMSESTGVMQLHDGGDWLVHDASTELGSSGAPILDQEYAFVGLHRGSVPGTGNVAIPLWRIVRDMKRRAAELRDKGYAQLLGMPVPETGLPWASPGSILRDVGTEVRKHRLNAAKLLIDRRHPDREILDGRMRRAVVHVVVCRFGDSHRTFLQRLSALTLPCAQGPADLDLARRSFLGSLRRMPGWERRSVTWPRSDLTADEALAEIKEDIDRFAAMRNVLVEVAADVADAEADRVRGLLEGLIEHCADEKYDADRMQVVVVFFDREKAADRWRQRRDELAGLWAGRGRPPGLGGAIRLREVDLTEMAAWCTDLGAAWAVDEERLWNDLLEEWAESGPMPMLSVEEAVGPIVERHLPLVG